MMKSTKSISLDNELWEWIKKKHNNISEFINGILKNEFVKDTKDPTFDLLSKEIQNLDESIEKLTERRNSVIEQSINLLTFSVRKQQKEQQTKEKALKDRLEAEKQQLKEVKKFIKSLKGIKQIIEEYKQNPDRDAKWYIQKMEFLKEKNNKFVGYSKLKLFLERCLQ